MKTRFNSYDIVCGVTELQKLVGLRVNQIYDIDNKTYLIRFQGGSDAKVTLLIESGIRFHTTSFEWPKNVAPSGFTMKLRKHLKNKRIEKIQQLGMDRIIDFQFGTGEASYHVFLELYDRGNIVLTDNELTILYILRPHYEGEEVRFAVREKYPISRAKPSNKEISSEDLKNLLNSAENGDSLRNILMPVLDCGPAVIDHVLTKSELNNCTIVTTDSSNVDENDEQKDSKKMKRKKKGAGAGVERPFNLENDFEPLMNAVKEAYGILLNGQGAVSKGYLIQKIEEKPSLNGETTEHLYQNIEYHPLLFAQFEGQPFAVFDSFMMAVDEFYSTLEGQKIDFKTIQQEREAYKKLTNVKKDHAKRLEELGKVQEVDKIKADIISCNQQLVDNAILAIRSALANQMSWPDIHELVKSAQMRGDEVASAIKQLKLEINHITLLLSDPYSLSESETSQPLAIDIDLGLSAWANARKYYDQKRSAAEKEQKTLSASEKALKSAERKTKETLKDVRLISTIIKARKVFWFEKFYWFISSENYLVIGGRDAQQNELIVKRYMRSSDIYVHAEIQGATSVIIRNPTGGEIPPKTLIEAGTMAISYSVAWDAKVVTNAYWVHSDQVSKTAPTGEYLGTGSFMIRGKKNFLPSCPLVMGLSLLFKLEDSFIEKHRGERKLRTFEDEPQQNVEQTLSQLSLESSDNDDSEGSLSPDHIVENTQLNAVLEVDENETSKFPDTEVKIEHDTGRVTVSGKQKSDISTIDKIRAAVNDNETDTAEETTIIPAVPARKKQQQSAKKTKKGEKNKKDVNKVNDTDAPSNKTSNIKRGQRAKLKKMKAKYANQDEEERELRMKILKSAGTDKMEGSVEEHPEGIQNTEPKVPREPKVHNMQQENDDQDVEEIPMGADLEMLDSLTGQPFEDDELLFAIPVVAPYQALQNYKFKVKLIPGTGKRGRAAKTALLMFGKEKGCTLREKDLLKSIKEESLARNIPGKVKLSVPQILRSKK